MTISTRHHPTVTKCPKSQVSTVTVSFYSPITQELNGYCPSLWTLEHASGRLRAYSLSFSRFFNHCTPVADHFECDNNPGWEYLVKPSLCAETIRRSCSLTNPLTSFARPGRRVIASSQTAMAWYANFARFSFHAVTASLTDT